MSIYIEPAIEIRRRRISSQPKDRMGIGDGELSPDSYPDKPSSQEEYYFEPITMERIVNDTQDYIIVGDSGIGKTSFLYWAVSQISSGKMESGFLPLFLELKDIAETKTKDTFLSILDTKYSLKDYCLQERRLLFLLDGLDQVIDYGNIADRLRDKDIFGRENRIILTTRPIGYEWIKDRLKYETLRILPFNEERIREYIGNDYNDSSEFQKILNQNKELLSIPILLKMVKTLLLEKRLTGIRSRAELYQGFIKYLFEKWEESKKGKLHASTTAIEIQKCLAILSYKALSDNCRGSFPLEKGLGYLNDKDRLDEVIFWSVTHNLVEKEGEKVIAYTHQSFQEYFAALQLKGKIFDKYLNLKEDVIIDHLEYTYWDEVWLFLVGGLEKKQAKKVIECIGKYDPYLAAKSLAGYTNKGEDFQGLIDWLLSKIEDKNARDVLAKIADTYIEDRLIGLLKDEFFGVRINALNAAWVLGEIKSEKAIEPLIGLLKDTKSWACSSVAGALDKINPEKAIEPLIGLLKDEDSVVRLSAAEVLVEINPEKAIEPLIGLLEDGDSRVRLRAVEALGKINPEEAIEPLMGLLKDENSWVRSHAAKALVRINPEKAIEPLIGLLEDKDYDVCSEATKALGKIKSEKAIELLIGLLKDKDSNVHSSAAEALGEIKSEKAIESLIGLLKEKDFCVRFIVAEVLGKIKSEKAIEPLIGLLEDEYLWVRKTAAVALGEIKSEKAIEPLIGLLKDEPSWVRSKAAEALGNINPEKAIEPLIELLRNEDSWVRRDTAEALGNINPEKAIEPLIGLLKDKDRQVRSSAAQALGKIRSERVVESLIRLLKDKDSYACLNAANALGGIKSEKAVEPLIGLLKNKAWFGFRTDNKRYSVCLIAAEALGNISTQLNPDEQSELVLRLSALAKKDKEDGYSDVITEIKAATGRRFLKELM
ncbi:HEAT repeat domain-containing protein [bacterium]|nr:HEAT repeat domain-containing protein [bacterium]MBU1752595.1 HEAT repeat domain-containing protein [bacterium]